MQNQSHGREQKPVDEVIIKNKFLSLQPSIEQENILSKASPSRLSLMRFNYSNTRTDIKRHDALSSVPLEHCDDLLDVRLTRQHSKHAHQHDEHGSVITINVSGGRYQTYLGTLELYPDTLLGDKNKREHYWNAETKEYFFDRHRACFAAILYYYQSNGRLRRPDFVPLDTFLEEISFFQLGSEASTQVHEAENIKKVEQIQMPRTLWRRYIWFYLEFPQHSIVARVINVVSMLFTILSCISLAVESLPDYNNRWDDICKKQANISLNSTFVPRCSAIFTSPFFIIQTICVVFFTAEFFLRAISTPSYYRFIFSFYNWIDLGAIVPYYVFLIIQLTNQDIGLDPSVVLSLRLLRILRFSRIFKIYLVFRRLKSLRVLSATIKESLTDFAVMITILTLLAFLFGAATYFAENETNGVMFDSIPVATYFGIVTVTGVGYGDLYPITPIGRILTCFCALFGSATMGMLVSVLVDRYQRVYNRKMYVSEPEVSPVDIETMSTNGDDTRSIFSLGKPGLRKNLSSALLHGLSVFQEKIKTEQRQLSSLQPYTIQFVVSFNDNTKDHNETDKIVTIMKTKLTEVVSNTDINVNLKLIDNDKQELWAMASSDSSSVFMMNTTHITNNDDDTENYIPD